MANIRAFAEDAPSGKRTVFNETTQSDDITTNLNDAYIRGWEAIGDNAPSIQDINAVGYTQGYLISYLYQQGVPAWSSEQGYMKYNMVNFEGKIYSCKIGDETNRCYNKNPKTEIGYWKEVGSRKQLSESNAGSSFLVKIRKSFRETVQDQNRVFFINGNYFELIRTKSDNAFSQVGDYKLYCPEKGVYFLKSSIIFRLYGSALSDYGPDEIDFYNNSKIIIYKNGVPTIETDFAFLFSWGNDVNFPVSVSGLIELDKGDYVSFGININGTTTGIFVGRPIDILRIHEGSFMGYKI